MGIVLGENVKLRQVSILTVSIVFTLIVFGAGLYSRNLYYLFIALFATIFFAGINALYAKLYEVRINENGIIISNLYQKQTLNVREFDSIVRSRKWIPPFILFPFSSPPYFIFKLKNNKNYLFLDASTKAFFSAFNVDDYIRKLNSQVINAINTDN